MTAAEHRIFNKEKVYIDIAESTEFGVYYFDFEANLNGRDICPGYWGPDPKGERDWVGRGAGGPLEFVEW